MNNKYLITFFLSDRNITSQRILDIIGVELVNNNCAHKDKEKIEQFFKQGEPEANRHLYYLDNESTGV